MNLAFPRLRCAGEIHFLGIAESYPEAHALALDQAHDYLIRDRGMSHFDAYAYASACCDMRLGGPASTIVMAVLPEE
jgi:hypothetical protein